MALKAKTPKTVNDGVRSFSFEGTDGYKSEAVEITKGELFFFGAPCSITAADQRRSSGRLVEPREEDALCLAYAVLTLVSITVDSNFGPIVTWLWGPN